MKEQKERPKSHGLTSRPHLYYSSFAKRLGVERNIPRPISYVNQFLQSCAQFYPHNFVMIAIVYGVLNRLMHRQFDINWLNFPYRTTNYANRRLSYLADNSNVALRVSVVKRILGTNMQNARVQLLGSLDKLYIGEILAESLLTGLPHQKERASVKVAWWT